MNETTISPVQPSRYENRSAPPPDGSIAADSPILTGFLESAIDPAFSTEGRQQFVLGTVDKLPEIGNVNELPSAGVCGILVAQDVYQLKKKYGT